ncbi:hypothetical protein ACIHCQ_38180 [Streptomyces sp. NPDC052236]|uniref:hypothetical protein n=1 Tax=Streptomyces sp. NPDC052236 TaxID=3365686 RepID=UPI0037D048C3
MYDNPARRAERKNSALLHRLLRWGRQRHRAALGLVLRGACWGLGTGAVSTAAYWVQNRL